MRQALLRAVLVASALAGAALVAVYRTLPDPATVLSAPVPATTVFGGYHIHSTRSDGSGTVDAIASAAHQAGLSFIILTDHGDGTRPPLAPAYRDGVLCIDEVEISTNGGHVVALGLSGAAPYPMAGEPPDVIEDIHRMGGFAVVAHPDSAKPELQWHAWNAPYDGVEWLNADSEWRTESGTRLAGVAVQMFLRGPETIASLFRRPVVTLRRWDATLRQRPVVGLAGLDAHANLMGWPRYVDMFKTLQQGVVLDHPLTGQAPEDATAVLAAIRAGHTFSIVGAFARPANLEFDADHAGTLVRMGDWTPAQGPLTWHVRVPQAPRAHIVLLNAGRPAASGTGALVASASPVPGAYRVEVTYPGFSMPWIVSNPIYVGAPVDSPSVEPPSPSPSSDLLDVTGFGGWRVEHDSASTGELDHVGGGLRFAYALGGGRLQSQYAAAALPVESPGGFDRVVLTARADRPMRVSIQVRLPGAGGGQRWRRSAYLDAESRQIVLPLASFTAADRPTSQQPIASAVQGLLIVVDTVNTVPGAKGTLWISAIGLGRTRPAGPTYGP